MGTPGTPGAPDGGDGDGDEGIGGKGDKKKRNNYKHLIKGVPGAFSLQQLLNVLGHQLSLSRLFHTRQTLVEER